MRPIGGTVNHKPTGSCRDIRDLSDAGTPMTLHRPPASQRPDFVIEQVDSLLIVLPAGADAGFRPQSTLLGLSVARRIALSAERAGFDRTVLLAANADVGALRDLLDGAPGIIVPFLEAKPLPRARRIVVLPGNVLPDRKWLAELRDRPVAAGTMDFDPAHAGVIEMTPGDPQPPIAAFGDAAPLDTLARHFRSRTCDLSGRGSFLIEPSSAPVAAETWLLSGLVKETDGFMSRLVARPVSLALTRRLAGTRITANAMTVVSTLVGLASAPFFLSTSPGIQVIGGMLFAAHSIIDGCDGELARLRFTESRIGGLLDFWGDNLVHVAVFFCMAIGWSLSAGAAWPLILGAAAVIGTAGSAGLVHWRTMRRSVQAAAPVGPVFTSVAQSSESRMSNILDGLARRDFIYLVLVLSAFGKSAWFLVLAAIGAPVFFILLMWVAHAERNLKTRESHE